MDKINVLNTYIMNMCIVYFQIKDSYLRILIFSCVGDSTKNYFTFIKNAKEQHAITVDTAIIYYGDDDRKANFIKDMSSFFWRKKTTVFLGFLDVFDDLPKYDYYLIVDDDIVFNVRNVVSAVNILKEHSIHAGTFSHSSSGKISYPFLQHISDSPKYEFVNFIEQNFAIISEELVSALVLKSKSLKLKYVTGWDFVLANCAIHAKLGWFLLFQNFVIKNPLDIEKKNGGKRELRNAFADSSSFDKRIEPLKTIVEKNSDFFIITNKYVNSGQIIEEPGKIALPPKYILDKLT